MPSAWMRDLPRLYSAYRGSVERNASSQRQTKAQLLRGVREDELPSQNEAERSLASMNSATTTTWVVGSGGLVGGSIAAGTPSLFEPSPISWASSSAARSSMRVACAEFASRVGDGPWCLFWAAGVGVVSSSEELNASDSEMLDLFIDEFSKVHPPGRGTIVLVSSAGGLYAGSSNPPFRESTPPVPISAYGREKLDQEGALQRFVGGRNMHLVVVRVANAYGPAQNLAKPQGLVTHACNAALTGAPLEIYVPLETRRHYVYAKDLGSIMLRIREAAQPLPAGETTIKNILGGPPATIAEIIVAVEQIHGAGIEVIRSNSGDPAIHPLEVRLTTETLLEVDSAPLTAINEGAAAVYEQLAKRLA